MNKIPLFLAAFSAALGRSPIRGHDPEPRKPKELTPLDRERIRKSIEKQTRKEQKRNEQRQRSKTQAV